MGIFASKKAASILLNGLVDPDKLGSGKGTPAGDKLLNDNQQYAKVTADTIDSTGATNGQKLKANGSGGASWG